MSVTSSWLHNYAERLPISRISHEFSLLPFFLGQTHLFKAFLGLSKDSLLVILVLIKDL